MRRGLKTQKYKTVVTYKFTIKRKQFIKVLKNSQPKKNKLENKTQLVTIENYSKL